MIFNGKKVGELHHLTFRHNKFPNKQNFDPTDLFGVKKFLYEHPEVNVLDFSQFCSDGVVYTTIWYTVPCDQD